MRKKEYIQKIDDQIYADINGHANLFFRKTAIEEEGEMRKISGIVEIRVWSQDRGSTKTQILCTIDCPWSSRAEAAFDKFYKDTLATYQDLADACLNPENSKAFFSGLAPLL